MKKYCALSTALNVSQLGLVVYLWHLSSAVRQEAENNFHVITHERYAFLGGLSDAKDRGEAPDITLNRNIELLRRELLAQLKESIERYPASDDTKHLATGLIYMNDYHKWGMLPDWLTNYVEGIKYSEPFH